MNYGIKHLRKKILLVSADIYRPAAQEQLQVLSKQIDIEQKNILLLVKKLASQKKVKIVYKKINSDINFKNKENEIKKYSEKFILDILSDLNKIKNLTSS